MKAKHMRVKHMQSKPWMGVSALGGLLVSAAFVSSLAAQGTQDGAASERIRTVNLAQKGAPPTGPHSVVIEHDQGIATHTIYRPTTPDASQYPLLVWGEGGCAKNGLTFPEFLSEIASHGFVVLADGPPVMPAAGGAGKGKAPEGAAKAKGAPGNAAAKGTGGPVGNMLDGTALIAAVDWMAKEIADPTSRFYGKVNTARVAAMGMSCGGLMSYGASADPRIATVGIWNSGLIQPDEKIFAGLHSPVIIVTGGESDIAYANGKRDFETMPARVPVFYGVYPSVGHGGTYNQDNGGAFGPAAVAWLK
jgi:dienelactone hydrolase